MTKGNATEDILELSVPAFGYELIREELLPEILGNHANDILYIAGKNLARKFPLTSKEELVDFFKKAGWGDITLLSEKKDELKYELKGELLSNRFARKKVCSFQIEAGFLAEQIQRIYKFRTEASEDQKKKEKVIFTIRWDLADSLE